MKVFLLFFLLVQQALKLHIPLKIFWSILILKLYYIIKWCWNSISKLIKISLMICAILMLVGRAERIIKILQIRIIIVHFAHKISKIEINLIASCVTILLYMMFFWYVLLFCFWFILAQFFGSKCFWNHRRTSLVHKTYSEYCTKKQPCSIEYWKNINFPNNQKIFLAKKYMLTCYFDKKNNCRLDGNLWTILLKTWAIKRYAFTVPILCWCLVDIQGLNEKKKNLY